MQRNMLNLPWRDLGDPLSEHIMAMMITISSPLTSSGCDLYYHRNFLSSITLLSVIQHFWFRLKVSISNHLHRSYCFLEELNFCLNQYSLVRFFTLFYDGPLGGLPPPMTKIPSEMEEAPRYTLLTLLTLLTLFKLFKFV